MSFMKSNKNLEIKKEILEPSVDGMLEDRIEIIIKQTFFTEDEEEEWFEKNKQDEEAEEVIDIYFMDDDKSW